MKNLTQWTVTEFRNLPKRAFGEDIGKFDSLVILPTRYKHDSGYRIMEFVAVKGETPIKRLGQSDVIHLLGIDGTNIQNPTCTSDYHHRMLTQRTFKASLRIDCLPCGLLRIFCLNELIAGMDLSSFELYVDENNISKL